MNNFIKLLESKNVDQRSLKFLELIESSFAHVYNVDVASTNTPDMRLRINGSGLTRSFRIFTTFRYTTRNNLMKILIPEQVRIPSGIKNQIIQAPLSRELWVPVEQLLTRYDDLFRTFVEAKDVIARCANTKDR